MRPKLNLGLVGVFCLGALIASPTFAQATKPAQKAKNKIESTQTTKKVVMEKITLDVQGAECAQCAKMLTSELLKHGVHGSVVASPAAPFRLVTEIDQTTDLGAASKAVMAAQTPHHAKVAPELNLVMFSKFDKTAETKATAALSKIKGVDAKKSKFDAAKGEVCIRLIGGTKVTAGEIHKALKDAGVTATLTKPVVAKKG